MIFSHAHPLSFIILQVHDVYGFTIKMRIVAPYQTDAYNNYILYAIKIS